MLVADYEIFKKDSLLGVLDIETNEVYQMWSISEIKEFIKDHLNEIWIRLQQRELRQNFSSWYVNW